uniref:Uncharacterized protein n=1 Tax=Kalanchoe fedtschenkoi TaxID=63787 RepID=A0A7N0U0Q4_KALFE
MMLKDLLNDATRRLLEDHSQMAAQGQSSSILPTKVFSMSVEEENSRKKLQRIHSPDISSSAVPVLVPSLSNPSNVFAFTATKTELSGAGSTSRARCEHSKPPTEATRNKIGGMRCRVCKRPRVTKATSTLSGGKLWAPSRDDDGKQFNSFSISSINSTQPEPSSLLLKFADSIANSKSKEGLQPKCSPSTATPALPSFYRNCADKKLEDTDQIVKEASQMVKLLESRIAALQQSTQAIEPPSERKIAMRAMNSCSASKKEEPLTNFLHAKKELKETSMLQPPPLNQSSRVADRSCQRSPNLLNLRAVTAFPSEAPSPSRRQSAAPSQSHKSSLARSNQILVPSPKQGSVKSQKLSRIPNQKSRPSLSLNNTVQRLQSLRVTSSPNHAPKYVNGFIVSPAPTQSKLEKENMHRAPAAHAGSTSSGVSRPSKPSNTQSQTRMLESTQKARNPTSKLMRTHKILSRQQSSSDYNAYSGCSVSSSSSSWTTTQQSRPTRSVEYSYSSGSLTSRTESSVSLDSSTEATRSSETSQSSQRRPSRAPSLNRRRREENRSPKEEPISRLRRIKNKLGLIFHHHHHHHHHHDVEKPKGGINRDTFMRCSMV